MKKLTVFIICCALALFAVGCGNQDKPSSGADTSSSQSSGAADDVDIGGDSSAQIANPFVECATLDEAAEAAGFAITAPETVAGDAARSVIRAMEGSMIELIYRGNENSVHIRKGTGSEDISGDYNSYAETNAVTVGDLEVTMKGDDGLVKVATWSDGEYSFSIGSDAGMSSDEMSALVQSVG